MVRWHIQGRKKGEWQSHCWPRLSPVLRKGKFMLEDASRSLLLAFDGPGRGDLALSGCKEREHCTVASVAGDSYGTGDGTWLKKVSQQCLPQITSWISGTREMGPSLLSSLKCNPGKHVSYSLRTRSIWLKSPFLGTSRVVSKMSSYRKEGHLWVIAPFQWHQCHEPPHCPWVLSLLPPIDSDMDLRDFLSPLPST